MMKLAFRSPYKSISQFETVELPDFTVLTGLNGSGKTHLLEAIKEGKAGIARIGPSGVIHYSYRDFEVSKAASSNNADWIQGNIQRIKALEEQIGKYVNGGQQKTDNYINQIANQLLDSSSLYHGGDALDAFRRVYNSENAQSIYSYGGPGGYAESYKVVHELFRVHYGNGGWYRDFNLPYFQQRARKLQRGAATVVKDKEEEFEAREPDLYHSVKSVISSDKDIFNLTPEDFDPLALSLQDLIEEERQYYVEKQLNVFRDANNNLGRPYPLPEKPPSFTFNNILSDPKYHCNGYQLVGDSRVQGVEDGIKVSAEVYLQNPRAGRVDFDQLSSGEKTLMALALLVHKAKSNKVTPSVLLLDEIDASLHPSMIKNLIESIQDVFVGTHRMKVILATHSPTTVALSPEESIFVIRNEEGKKVIQKQSQQEALDLLTEGFATMNEDKVDLGIQYNISKTDLPVLFTEGITDKIIVETAWRKLYHDKGCPFYIQDCFDALFLANLFKRGTDNGFIHEQLDRLFLALFDFDGEGYNQWNGIKGCTGYESDPEKCLTKVHTHGNAYALLLPVSNIKVKQQVLKSDQSKETFKHDAHMPIELLFYNIAELNSFFHDELTPGGGRVIKFVGNKSKFANKITTIDNRHFEVFRPLFDKIDQIIQESKNNKTSQSTD